MRPFLRSGMLVFTLVASAAAARPNILLILADDLGWSDLACYGADLHETPRLDHLAQQSVRFSQAYAMSVCSPTRATLLTGKHAARLHITIWSEGSLQGPKNRRLLQGDSRHDLPHQEKTLATLLHDAGYLTALVGKWHLGGASHFPETHGFDVNIGGTHWGAPQTFFWPYAGTGRFGGEFRYVPHLEFGKTGEYLTDRLTDEALNIIDRAGDQPFFLYLAHHAVHTPIEAKPSDVAHFADKIRPDLKHQHPVYAAMVKNLDDNVGRVLDHLEKRGLMQNTVVIFTSDNGGYIGKDAKATLPVTNNSPLRSGKGSLYEGGIRVPLMIRGPKLAPGVSEEPVIVTDLFQTCLGFAGVSAPTNAVDGVELQPVLADPTKSLNREALYFHYPHYYQTTTPVSATRAGDWKLLEYFEDQHVELYQLRDDRSELHDLAATQPAKAAALRQQLHAWRESVQASLPTPNPDFKSKP